MIYHMSGDQEMNPELLAKYIQKHKTDVSKRLQKLWNAYVNDYEIYHQQGKASWKPDNRISINFAKYLTDTYNGFFIGIPVKVSSIKEPVEEFVELIDNYNDQDTNNFEIAKLMAIFGSAHEMYYHDAEGNICITYLSPMQSFFIVDDSILERPLYFVRYYRDADNIERGSWSDASVVQHFVNEGSYRWTDEAAAHNFGDVPATEYIENDERLGVFESALPAINHYNKVLSEKANDVDAFADAYLKVLGADVDDKDVPHIRENRVINFKGDYDKLPVVDFMAKPSADGTQEHLIDRLEKNIFIESGIPNINDENFGSASGVAIRYKLWSMGNLFRQKSQRFRAGLNRRYRVLFTDPGLPQGVSRDDWVTLKFDFTPNYPANIADEAATAAQLSGIVSRETQLKVLSIVDNPSDEAEKIAKENAEQLDIYGDLSNGKAKKKETAE